MLFKKNHNELGRTYADGEFIFRQGEPGECLYIILDGQVEIVVESPPPLLLDVLGKEEVFGAVSLFDGLPRPVSARARGQARVLTVDRKGFLKRLEEDPSLTLRILENIALRTRRYIAELVRLRQSLAVDPCSASLATDATSPSCHQTAGHA